MREGNILIRFADLNGDDAIDVSDLLILLGNWGQCDNLYNCPGDLNGDGIVDVSDMLLLLGNWGRWSEGTKARSDEVASRDREGAEPAPPA